MTRTATLSFGDKTIELPVIEGSEGELAVEITQLRARTGLITLDPGFGNTGACQSATRKAVQPIRSTPSSSNGCPRNAAPSFMPPSAGSP